MRNKTFPFYPFLLALFPILSLYAGNANQLIFSVVYRPAAVFLLVTAVVMGFFWGVFRDRDKGAMMATALLGLSCILAIGWDLLPKSKFSPETTLALSRGTLALGAVLGGMAFYQIRRMRDPRMWAKGLTTLGGVLVVLPLLQIAFVRRPLDAPASTPLKTAARPEANAPDIYYIILDGYGRQDILKEYFNYDNSKFIQFLKDRGFYVCSQSRSNYSYTALSLSSSLNMEYVPGMQHAKDQWVAAADLIHYNRVSQFLKNRGYRILHFNSGWIVTTENRLADYTFDAAKFGEFEALLLSKITPEFLTDRFVMKQERQRILFNLKKLSEVPKLPGPKFTFAHFICPHPPFIFTQDGRLPEGRDVYIRFSEHSWLPKQRYVDQLAFMSASIQKVIDNILRQSRTPPIIILQADHGPGSDGIQLNPGYGQVLERTTILNAYYVPPQTRSQLFDTLTPVNSFRIVFDTVFGSHFGLLPQRTYYSGEKSPPYSMMDVTDLKSLPRRPISPEGPLPDWIRNRTPPTPLKSTPVKQ